MLWPKTVQQIQKGTGINNGLLNLFPILLLWQVFGYIGLGLSKIPGPFGLALAFAISGLTFIFNFPFGLATRVWHLESY